jgi:hypothetical protein
MVGLVAIGIITAVTTLKDSVSTVLTDAAGQTYTDNLHGRTINLQLLVNGTTVTGSVHDPGYMAARDSRVSGTLIGNNIDFVRSVKTVSTCKQRYVGTTSDGGKSFIGTATEIVPGTCGGSFAFHFIRLGG